jgi:hypothetical protein
MHWRYSNMRRWRALAIAPVAALLITAPVLAQDGTPTPGEEESARIPAPSECVSTPVPFDQIDSILALEGQGIPQPPYMEIKPPLGDIVDPDTDLQIKEAVREILACFNAGDIPRAAALMTENGIKRSYWGLTVDAENRGLAKERIAATPEPRAADFDVRLVAITDTSKLPDGRVAAFVVINEPLLPPAGPETLLFVFANQNGEWKLDDFVDFSVVPPGYATPTASA